MAETNYGVAKLNAYFPLTDLLRAPHKGKTLVLSHPAFGPEHYSKNLDGMQEIYSHLPEFFKISFRPATTSESISAVSFDFKNLAKSQIFDDGWLQLGYILKTSQGFYANPPRDKKGNILIDEKKLEDLLDKGKKVNGIYLCKNDFGFAPYETFKQGAQDYDTFIAGGLARLLEHTKEKTARNLSIVASSKFYKKGVNVFGFDKVKNSILRIASLGSNRDVGSRLDISGDWDDGCYGFAFGIIKYS